MKEKGYKINNVKEFRDGLSGKEKKLVTADIAEITGLNQNTINSFLKDKKEEKTISANSVKGYYKLFENQYDEDVDEYAKRFEDYEGVKILLLNNGKKCVIKNISKETDKIIVYLEKVLQPEDCAPKHQYEVLYKGNNCMRIIRNTLTSETFIPMQCDKLTVWAFKSLKEELEIIKEIYIEETELIILIHEERADQKKYKRLQGVTIMEIVVDKKTEEIKEVRCVRKKNSVSLRYVFLKVYQDILIKMGIPLD